jgi:hypothetical protein
MSERKRVVFELGRSHAKNNKFAKEFIKLRGPRILMEVREKGGGREGEREKEREGGREWV